MKARASGASAKHTGFSAEAVARNTAAATPTATHACRNVSLPDGSSRARVRGFRASSSRSAMRLNPRATNRAAVKASTTRPSVRQVSAVWREATSTPSSAKGSANTVCGSLTKFAYRARRLSPANVCPSRPGEVNSKVLPHRVDTLLRFRIHDDLVRPFARKPLFLPLARRVDSHLRAEREAPARMVEHVDRPHREPHVTLGVDVVQGHPPRLLRIAHVDVLVQHDDHLGERHQPLPPQAVHHLVGLPGILLVDGDEHEVVEDSLGRHVQVYDLG